MVLFISTVDATPTTLKSDAFSVSSTNQYTLANNQAMAITGQIICRESVTGADAAAGWAFSCVIRRGANAASTTLVAACTPTLIAADAGLATASVAITADTTNGCLKIAVTGVAATNLHWVASVESAETI